MKKRITVELYNLQELIGMFNKGKCYLNGMFLYKYNEGCIKWNAANNKTVEANNKTVEADNKKAQADNEAEEIILDKQPKESVVRRKIERKTRSWKSYGWNVR